MISIKKSKKKCKVPICDRIATIKKHELCGGHYAQYKKKGKVENCKIRLYKPIPVFEIDTDGEQ